MQTRTDEDYLWQAANTTFSVLNAVLETPVSLTDLCGLPEGVRGQLRKASASSMDVVRPEPCRAPCFRRKGFFIEVNDRAFKRAKTRLR